MTQHPCHVTTRIHVQIQALLQSHTVIDVMLCVEQYAVNKLRCRDGEFLLSVYISSTCLPLCDTGQNTFFKSRRPPSAFFNISTNLAVSRPSDFSCRLEIGDVRPASSFSESDMSTPPNPARVGWVLLLPFCPCLSCVFDFRTQQSGNLIGPMSCDS